MKFRIQVHENKFSARTAFSYLYDDGDEAYSTNVNGIALESSTNPYEFAGIIRH